MSMKFQFFGFRPDDDLISRANHLLERLLDLSPYGSVPVALLEKTPDGFRCAIDLYTQHGPFVAHAYRDSATVALQHAGKALHRKLDRWREERPSAQPREISRLALESFT